MNKDSLVNTAALFQPTGAVDIYYSTMYPYWSVELSDDYVVAMIATGNGSELTVNFSDVPGLGSAEYAWIEFWSGSTGMGTSVIKGL